MSRFQIYASVLLRAIPILIVASLLWTVISEDSVSSIVMICVLFVVTIHLCGFKNIISNYLSRRDISDRGLNLYFFLIAIAVFIVAPRMYDNDDILAKLPINHILLLLLLSAIFYLLVFLCLWIDPFRFRKRDGKLRFFYEGVEIKMESAAHFKNWWILSIIAFLANSIFSYSLVDELAGENLSFFFSMRITLALLICILISYVPFLCLGHAYRSIKGVKTTILVGNAVLFVLCTFITDTLVRYSNIKTGFVFSVIMIYVTIIFSLYYIFNRGMINNSVNFIKEITDYRLELNEDIKKRKKGDMGESNVRFHLKHLELSDETPFKVINNQNFSFKGYVQAQLDHVVICRKGVFLLETKNHSATIVIAKNGDWLQKRENDKLSPYGLDPSFQCTRHRILIRNILYSNGYPDAPIKNIIVLANQSQHISNPEYSKNRLIKVDKLLEVFTNENSDYPDVLTDEQIDSIYSVLVNSEVEGNKHEIKVFPALLKWVVWQRKTYSMLLSALVFLFLIIFSANTLTTGSVLYKEQRVITMAPEIRKLVSGSNDALEATASAMSDEASSKPSQKQSAGSSGQDTSAADFYIDVESHKTYLDIMDGKKTILEGTYSKGTEIYFYSDKSITMIRPDGAKDTFNVSNEVLNLEVGNDYTKVVLNGVTYRNLRKFRYDIVKNEIIK